MTTHKKSLARRLLPLIAVIGAIGISLLILLAGVDIGHRYVSVSTNFATATRSGPTKTSTTTTIVTRPGTARIRYMPQPAVTVMAPPRPRATVTRYIPGPTITRTVTRTATVTATVTSLGFNSSGVSQ